MNATTTTEAKDAQPSDLGFSHRVRKNASIDIFHRARLASTLRGDAADAFMRLVNTGGEAAAQQLMATHQESTTKKGTARVVEST